MSSDSDNCDPILPPNLPSNVSLVISLKYFESLRDDFARALAGPWIETLPSSSLAPRKSLTDTLT